MNGPSINSSIPINNVIPASAEDLKSPPSWATGSAKQEELKWDDLEVTKRQNDKRWLAVYGWLLLAITVVFAVTFLLALIAWVWHYLGPERWLWLKDYQLSKIQSVLFSGGMGAIISNVIRTQLEKAH